MAHFDQTQWEPTSAAELELFLRQLSQPHTLAFWVDWIEAVERGGFPGCSLLFFGIQIRTELLASRSSAGYKDTQYVCAGRSSYSVAAFCRWVRA